MSVQLRSSPSGRLFDVDAALTSWGLQTAWAIDPLTGNDDNLGTPTAPLRTMGEFNQRMSGNLLQVPAALQLVGDVTDQPMMLFGTRLTLNSTLTVSGTRTVIGRGTITAVTPIGLSGTTYPWQLTTTGYDWSAHPAGAQITLSQGAVAFMASVVDANNVVIGAVTTTPSVQTLFTPTVGLTFEVATLSRSLPPIINGAVATTGAGATVSSTWQNLSFSGPFTCSVNGIGTAFQGCEFVSANQIDNSSGSTVVHRCCRFTMGTQNLVFRASGARMNQTACVFASSAVQNVLYSTGQDFFSSSCTFFRASVAVAQSYVSISTGGWFFDTVTSGPVLNLLNGARVKASATNAIVNGRNCTGATFGLDITEGIYVWNLAANKPTIGIASGASSDVRLGAGGSAVGFTYAALGTGKQYSFLDAVPPTTTQIQLAGYAAAGQLA